MEQSAYPIIKDKLWLAMFSSKFACKHIAYGQNTNFMFPARFWTRLPFCSIAPFPSGLWSRKFVRMSEA